MDVNLNSVYLERNPRRESFRNARELLNDAIGCHTIAANVKIIDNEAMTCVPGQEKVIPSQKVPISFILDRGKVLPLFVGVNRVGRLSDNEVVIDDPCVSRHHCVLLIHSDLSCEIHDIASKNGTMLNGQPITRPTRIVDGDELTLCSRKLLFSKSPDRVRPNASPTPKATFIRRAVTERVSLESHKK